MSRRIAVGVALGAVALLGGVAASTGTLSDLAIAGSTAEASPTPSANLATAEVERRTLQTEEELEGTLGYEGSVSVLSGGSGTVTRVPDTGTVVERGDVLFELDGTRRTRLFYGARPMWRTLDGDVSNGNDVLQLERNLKALGYAPTRMKVDRNWTAKTTKAVKAWQKATGQERDGVVEIGDIVFLPDAIRVSSIAAKVGTTVAPGAPALEATSATLVVTVDLDASDRDMVAEGQTVTVKLPDAREVDGSVRTIGRVAELSEDGSSATIPVAIELTDASAAPDLDQAPVDVLVVSEQHENVLAVPVNALMALLEGGYAVELVRADGSHDYVAVTIGLFEDGMVEIEGEGLEAGNDVAVAR